MRSLWSNSTNLNRKFLLVGLILFSNSVYSQSINRVEVNGVLLSKNNDVEAVTVFNTSSNKGTITDVNGKFQLHVALHDIIEISALQYQTVSIKIDADIIKSKQLKIQLVEQVNQLDAVSLSSGLTGNMITDIVNVKTPKPMTLEMGNMNVDFEYNDDKAFDNSEVANQLTKIIDPNARAYMPDILKIVGLLTKSKKKLVIKKDVFVGYTYEKPKDLLSVFTLKDIQEQFEIPENQCLTFVAFVENTGVEEAFLEPENKLLLVEFLVQQSKLFLKPQDDKN